MTDSYRKSWDKHGASPKALQWNSYKSMAVRYKELVASLPVDGHTVLDAGCGMGDLLPFLYAKSDNFDYTGMDITPEFIDIAKKRYDGHKFVTGNVFGAELDEKFDIVICCGALNAFSDNWLAERSEKIDKLFELCNVALAFNMAGSFAPKESTKKITYADAGEILKFCLTLTPKVVIKSNYSSIDFTVTLYR